MTKRIIIVSMVLLVVFSFAPVYKANALSEAGIRDVCRQEIANWFETQPTISSGVPNDPSTLEGRITNLETKTKLIEQLLTIISGLLNQLIGMISKIV